MVLFDKTMARTRQCPAPGGGILCDGVWAIKIGQMIDRKADTWI